MQKKLAKQNFLCTIKDFNNLIRPCRLARLGHKIFILTTGVRIPTGTPDGFIKTGFKTCLFFCVRLAFSGGWNFCDSKNPQGKRSAVQLPHQRQRVVEKRTVLNTANEEAAIPERLSGFFVSIHSHATADNILISK